MHIARSLVEAPAIRRLHVSKIRRTRRRNAPLERAVTDEASMSAKLPRLARWQLGQANTVSHDAGHDAEVVADGRRTPQLAIKVRVSDPYLA